MGRDEWYSDYFTPYVILNEFLVVTNIAIRIPHWASTLDEQNESRAWWTCRDFRELGHLFKMATFIPHAESCSQSILLPRNQCGRMFFFRRNIIILWMHIWRQKILSENQGWLGRSGTRLTCRQVINANRVPVMYMSVSKWWTNPPYEIVTRRSRPKWYAMQTRMPWFFALF